jgi:hypothetical protein
VRPLAMTESLMEWACETYFVDEDGG